jgi:hypothetical protein
VASSSVPPAAAFGASDATARAVPSPGRRLAAFFVDALVVAVLILFALFASEGPARAEAIARAVLPYGPCAYLMFRDAIGGRSLGTLATGLVVWDDTAGRPGGFMDSVIRNWPLALLMLPIGGPLVQGLLWPLYVVKLAAAATAVMMFWQVLRRRPKRILEGPATTRVILVRQRPGRRER